MSLGFRHKKSDDEGDFELNIASIIDCFTVLITYLLVSASFISLGVLDVSVSGPTVSPATSAGQTTVDVSIDIDLRRNIRVKVSGPATESVQFPPRPDGNWDFQAMNDKLHSIRDRWPDVNYALLSAENAVEYKEVVRAIEAAREVIPSVSLGEREI